MCTRDWETRNDLNCVGIGNLTGANYLAALYKADESVGLVGSTAQTVISNIVAYGYMYATTQCNQGSYIKQSINIQCDDAKGVLVSSNKNCRYCQNQVEAIIADRNSLEQNTALFNPNYKIQSYTSQQLYDLRATCNYVCSQCVVMNLRQELSANMTISCDVSSETFQKGFLLGMQTQANIEVAQNASKLIQMGMQVRDKNEIDHFSMTMVDSLKQIITTTKLESLKQQAIMVQELTIEPGSTSVLVQNLSQNLSLVMYSSLISSELSMSKLKVAIDYKDKAEILQLKTDLDAIIKAGKDAGLEAYSILTSIITDAPTIITFVFAILILIGFAFVIFRSRAARDWIKKEAKNTVAPMAQDIRAQSNQIKRSFFS